MASTNTTYMGIELKNPIIVGACSMTSNMSSIKKIEEQGAEEIARRSRGTPRIANRLLRRVRDYAEVKADGKVTREIACRAMGMLNVDEQGFDAQDRLDACSQRRLREVHHSVENAVVGNGHGRLAIGSSRIHHVIDARGTVEHREL